MKIFKKKSPTKLIIASIVGVLLISAILYFTVGKAYFEQSNSNSSTTNNTQSDDTPDSSAGDNDPTPVPGVTDNSTKTDTDEGTNPDQPSLVITSSNQNGSVFQVRVLINTVVSSGSCKITFTRENFASVEKTADIQAGPSTTTCKGFDIPLSELAVGSWTMKVTYIHNDYSAQSTKTIEIE